MKTIAVSRRAKSVTALLGKARHENLILILPDGSEFVLAEIDTFDQEIKLARQNRQLMELLDQRARQSKRVPLAEAKQALGLNGQRKSARRRSRRPTSAAGDAD
jgi:hypothetical protein